MKEAVLSRMAGLEEVSLASEELFRAQTLLLPTSLIYSNADEYDPIFAKTSVGYSHCAREVCVAPVLLCTFPQNTVVLADSWFTTFSDDAFVLDQFAPPFREKGAKPEELLCSSRPVIDVDEPCLLVARFGEGTWGHWLGELLPRAILAELAYPGKFKFAVPAWTTTEQPQRGLAHAINESLQAYGITEDRYLRLRMDTSYRFGQLFGLTSVWSDHTMHPAVVNCMRNLVPRLTTEGPLDRIACLRKTAKTRNIINLDEIAQQLQQNGFQILDLNTMSFLDQVAAFQGCSLIFSVLGSELTSLIYAADQVKVVSAGPANWADRFFYPLIQLRNGLLADVRGTADWKGEQYYRQAPFKIDPRQVEIALERLSTPMTQLAPNGYISVSGLTLPRRVGRCEFTIDFTTGGNSPAFVKEGWSLQERSLTWCLGPRSDLVIPAPLIEGDYQLDIRVCAATRPPYIMAQKMDILINGEFADSFFLLGWMDLVCRVPRAAVTGRGSLHLELHHPIFVSSQAMGVGADTREASVGFARIRLRRCESNRS